MKLAYIQSIYLRRSWFTTRYSPFRDF